MLLCLYAAANDDNIKKNPRTSLQVLLPKLPSSDSLSNSPGPSSPGSLYNYCNK